MREPRQSRVRDHSRDYTAKINARDFLGLNEAFSDKNKKQLTHSHYLLVFTEHMLRKGHEKDWTERKKE